MLPILVLPCHRAAVVPILVVRISGTRVLPSVGLGVLATTIVWARRVRAICPRRMGIMCARRMRTMCASGDVGALSVAAQRHQKSE